MPLPQVPDRFQALEELTRGETGTLVRARDKLLQREVVLKLPPEAAQRGADSAEERERELREARALARVRHRAIVRLLDVLESPAGPVLVLEPTSGESLAEKLLREQRLDADYVRTLALELADALAAVHAIGVVHRGIALDQILLAPDGRPLLGGFGFAKFSGPAVAIPGTTFLYAREGQPPAQLPPHPAPEQIAGQTADARSDLFGLGWVLYECLTGEEPYPIELEVAHWKTPRDPRALVPGTPRDLSEALLRCLAKSPAKRFAGAEELKAALASESPSAPVAVPARAIYRVPRLVGVGMIVLGLLGYGAWRQIRPAEASPDRGFAARTEADKHLAGPPYAVRRAVVIGINEYQNGWPRLGCAVADAQSVAKLLEEDYGFEHDNIVPLLNKDATRDNIYHCVGKLAEVAGPEDCVLFYFAGHGQTEPLHPSGAVGYLVPVDGVTEQADYMARLIPIRQVEETWSRQLRCKHVLFVLDSCFSGLSLTRSAASVNREYVGMLSREPARMIITAGSDQQEVAENPDVGHSYFTDRLLRGLGKDLVQSHPGGVITAGELATYLQANVAMDTAELPTQQNPQFSPGAGQGQFLFLTKTAREALEKK